jgi:periplasmic divalent cation tolerance protein
MDADPSASAVEIQVTCGGADEAGRIADALVARRLAACVQQMPIRSTYRWEGEVQHDDEVLLLVKTVAARVGAVAAVVDELHSYDLPALTVVRIIGGTPDYLAWLATESDATP